jgi:nitrogen regulatory protein PII
LKIKGDMKYLYPLMDDEKQDFGTGVMKYVPEFGFGTKVEVLVSDSQAKQIIDDILIIKSTGSAYDGKIFVLRC